MFFHQSCCIVKTESKVSKRTPASCEHKQAKKKLKVLKNVENIGKIRLVAQKNKHVEKLERQANKATGSNQTLNKP